MSRREANRRTAGAWRRVLAREVVVKLTDRAYLISTFLSLALIIGSTVMSAYLTSRTETLRVVVSDSASEQLALEMQQFGASGAGSTGVQGVEFTRVVSADEARKQLTDRQADVAVFAVTDLGSPAAWDVVTLGPPDRRTLTLLEETLRSSEMKRLIAASGEDPAAVSRNIAIRASSINSDAASGFYLWIVGLGFAALFYMSSMTFGIQIAQSVLVEKQSRIVELIISTIPIRHLLIGKVMGTSLIALLQMVILTGSGVACAMFTPARHVLPMVSGAAGWFIIMFLAGFVSLAGIWAAAGALCTRSEDLQYSTQPITLLLSAVFLIGAMAHGTLRLILSYVPLLSTILMPIRIMEGDAHWWDALTAFILSVVFGALAVVAGDRIYRRAILQTGRRFGYREMLGLKKATDVLAAE